MCAAGMELHHICFCSRLIRDQMSQNAVQDTSRKSEICQGTIIKKLELFQMLIESMRVTVFGGLCHNREEEDLIHIIKRKFTHEGTQAHEATCMRLTHTPYCLRSQREVEMSGNGSAERFIPFPAISR